MLRRQLLTGLRVTIALIVLLGVVYPLAVWAVGRIAFRPQADGSFVNPDRPELTDAKGNPLPQYFQPRPSSAGTNGYDSTSSSGSNLGPTNPNLVGNNIDDPRNNPYRTPADPYCVPVPATDKNGKPQTDAQGQPVYEKNSDAQLNGLPAGAPVPVDGVTASGSGLDPDITEANALDQAPRIARTRHLDVARVVALVQQHTNGRAWGILGENTVNVLDLNLALDRLSRTG